MTQPKTTLNQKEIDTLCSVHEGIQLDAEQRRMRQQLIEGKYIEAVTSFRLTTRGLKEAGYVN